MTKHLQDQLIHHSTLHRGHSRCESQNFTYLKMVSSIHIHALHKFYSLIELDDGKILTGKPDQFDGKNHGFRFRFSLKPIQFYSHTIDKNGRSSYLPIVPKLDEGNIYRKLLKFVCYIIESGWNLKQPLNKSIENLINTPSSSILQLVLHYTGICGYIFFLRYPIPCPLYNPNLMSKPFFKRPFRCFHSQCSLPFSSRVFFFRNA